MDENRENGMEEMDDDLIYFEDDEGNEYAYRVEDYFFYNGEEYALLSEADEEAEEDADLGCIVCKIENGEDQNGEETEEFVPVEDTDLAEKLFEIANNKLNDEDEEEE